MSASTRSSVAFQGEPGAFSHTAALKLLHGEADICACASFREVFETLNCGAVQYAVIPIENTLHGSIHENYDHLLAYNFFIAGETNIRISHQLIARPGTRVLDLRQVYSHPVALNQCRNFFLKHSTLEAVSFYDTAGSVKWLMESGPTSAAAIASVAAAEIYGGEVLECNIEDNAANFTRFFLLTKQEDAPRAGQLELKSSVVFTTRNTPGALFRALACFALRDLDLTKIESRPLIGKPWEYLFYIDFLQAARDPRVENALRNLREITEFCRVLGTYQTTP